MMEYIVKASAVIALFYTCYKVFLQRDTFFEQNRLFLLIGLVSAVFIPFIIIQIYVEQPAISLENYVFTEAASGKDMTNNSITISSFLLGVYVLGLIVFAIRFLVQLSSLLLLLIKGESNKLGRYIFVKTTKEVSPFSFFNYIVYNPNKFNNNELKQIIAHEKVHVCQYHTIDILLAQLACMVFWFNPFVWLYNNVLKQNLEFIADETAVNNSTCKKSYQYTLLKTSIPTHQLALTNNFYTSLIKKRIVMLHKSKSKKINQFKYILIIPLLALFLMSFNTKEVIIEKKLAPTNSKSPEELPVFNDLLNVLEPETEKNPIEKPVSNNFISKTSELSSSSIEVIITKDYSDSDFEKLKTKFENEGYNLKIKGIKRNKQGDITAIKIEVSSKSSNANYNINTDDAISPIKISIDDDGKNISIGNGNIKKEHQMVFVSKDGKKHVLNHASSENNVFVVSSDDGKDDSTKIEEYIVKGDDGKKTHKLIKIKTDDNDSNLSWATDNDDKVIIKNKDNATFEIKSDGGEEPLFIVDGKKITQEELKSINQNEIHSVYVLKGEQALKEYGNEGKEGVVVIKLKDKDTPEYVVKLKTDALYIADGKEITSKEMKDIDPENIKSVDVLKGDHATEKYGEKGKNGVILITTKNK